MPAKLVTLRQEAPRWLRYLYFMRFSILLWLFPLFLLWANKPTNARALVSGIVTPSECIQYLCVVFFLVAAGFVALILARVVVINGKERFGDDPPHILDWLLTDDAGWHVWIAPAASQVTNLILFWYFWSNGRQEDVNGWWIILGLAAGVVLAGLFWTVVNAIYYLIYRPGGGAKVAPRLGRRAARTLLFPRRSMWLSTTETQAGIGDVLEDASTPDAVDHFLSRSIGWLIPWGSFSTGYRWPNGDIYEGHFFSLIAAFGFFTLYWTLFPLTAPVPERFWSHVSLALYFICGLLLVALVWSARPANPASARTLRAWKIVLSVFVILFAVSIPLLYEFVDAERFPILALVMILMISLAWALGYIAFFADRFRIPVLSLMILVTVLPRVFHWDGLHEEHYLSAALIGAPAQLPTPRQALERKLEAFRNQPVIIVTATGGGIHAAGWTTAVLAKLEKELGPEFHKHLVLASTVSGGSAGLLAYLRELNEHTLDGSNPDPVLARMQNAASCSSLEAVGWGLVYYDFPKAFVPVLPYFWTPSNGVDDLYQSPLGKDRTWALRKAFARNLNDRFCQLGDSTDRFIQVKDLVESERRNEEEVSALTLGNLNPIEHEVPAFSMNTTTVEDGDRFLLANYQIERHPPNQLVPQPAESFLQVFGGTQLEGKYADLPLATAAQLSATFPYVSSAATFYTVGQKAVHFVDGGYYDNDGTASAMEFLYAALDGDAAPQGGGATDGNDPADHRVRVLLIEIRNSPDTPQDPEQWKGIKPDPDKSYKPWNLADQLAAPPKAFYSGGHESVTGRNRNGLVLLTSDLKDKMILEHFVIDDQAAATEAATSAAKKDPPTDPLNWSLTPHQKGEIRTSAGAEYNLQKYAQIKTCFTKHQNCPSE